MGGGGGGGGSYFIRSFLSHVILSSFSTKIINNDCAYNKFIQHFLCKVAYSQILYLGVLARKSYVTNSTSRVKLPPGKAIDLKRRITTT